MATLIPRTLSRPHLGSNFGTPKITIRGGLYSAPKISSSPAANTELQSRKPQTPL
ncbi:hypothetical protein B0T16DRAFT_201952 [Cercophora newfieldiana]|uniref:Uncharacterized protein n=1 Tax=Cercophora newfieldiana TaxID=92897 RepID=A0AA39XV25_9PEZI|nr:hypothetical protein B0T16DRAFT_201952 [Cercophora newfieldiana]